MKINSKYNKVFRKLLLQFKKSQIREANLYRADLSEADLSGADLSKANLSGANLSGANLSIANLSGANLSKATLSKATLSKATLSVANLSEADLYRANLYRANLYRANLSVADLSGADLSKANLSGANLSGANYNENTSFFALQCPETGAFICYKKCINNSIVEMLVSEDAKRSSSTTRKCRASYIKKCITIWDENGEEIDRTYSIFNNIKTTYAKNQPVYPNNFDENRWNECSTGIHFFITKREAELYNN